MFDAQVSSANRNDPWSRARISRTRPSPGGQFSAVVDTRRARFRVAAAVVLVAAQPVALRRRLRNGAVRRAVQYGGQSGAVRAACRRSRRMRPGSSGMGQIFSRSTGEA